MASRRYNANLTSRQLRTYCPLDDACSNIMKSAVNDMGLSARATTKPVGCRTIADLDAADHIGPEHVTEAIN